MAESVRREGKRFTCGVYTAGDALFALSDNGHHDLAYALFANEEGPSYGYMYRHGATSLWERWDTYNHYLAHLQPTKRWQAPLDCQTELSDSGNAHIGMNSYNHIEHTYSSGWLTECVLGLRGDISMGGGYRHFTVHPCWGEENRAARGEFTTPRGTIVVDWQYGEDGTYTMDLTVPANCFARVYLPAAAEHCFCDKTALSAVRECSDIRPETDGTSFAVVSGVYRFTCTATV
jgi:alpha-L-rhamnosidase